MKKTTYNGHQIRQNTSTGLFQTKAPGSSRYGENYPTIEFSKQVIDAYEKVSKEMKALIGS
jgi:hypothetical protein